MRYKRVDCADGFSFSVQARSSECYCEPKGSEGPYSSCEVGYPSEEEELLLPFDHGDGVYGWVDVDVIRAVIERHGGMVQGTLPPGV